MFMFFLYIKKNAGELLLVTNRTDDDRTFEIDGWFQYQDRPGELRQ
jgi:hypothetical protein